MKIYQVCLCQVRELKDSVIVLDESPIRTFADRANAEKEKEECMKELKKKEGYDETKEWLKVEEWIVH